MCFRCDEMYTLGHMCKDRTPQILTVCYDEKAEDGGGSEALVEEELHLDMVNVSLNSMVGFTPNHTMKVKGEIAEREMMVLIDNEATQFYLQPGRRSIGGEIGGNEDVLSLLKLEFLRL
ncbi:hypothetical protein KFK09_021267 [Dendrobium nobile]|uniref:Uncharacterized protein n=1 Tax=Dendrobium nobile TaxID=94219 RepID=A0A8T3AN93_DENNO|nr:hypothetical protein KFK09_021267 [Dendrobium nobile]